MRFAWTGRLVLGGLGVLGVLRVLVAAQSAPRVLQEDPAIQYATRATTDRVGALARAVADGTRTLARDPRTGYVRAVLDALNIPIESQMLVFSKTGIQADHTSPRNPRSLFFDRSVIVGYIPGAPLLEIASHDPQQGVIFYTVNQAASTPAITRQTMCLSCHISASTLGVPGVISRSNAVDDDGNVLPKLGTNDVTHETPHPDRWGGWFVTSQGLPAPYNERAHEGNITFTPNGSTSNRVFVEWSDSTPEARGYLSASSDIVSLLVFDHEMHAINLLTRLNWESRVGAGGEVERLARELGDYLLFTGEVPPSVPLEAMPAFARHLATFAPADRLGRSCAQLNLDTRLMRHPCSFMVYSDAFEALPASVKQRVYQQMIARLSTDDTRPARYAFVRLSPEERRNVLGILRDTKPDFPR